MFLLIKHLSFSNKCGIDTNLHSYITRYNFFSSILHVITQKYCKKEICSLVLDPKLHLILIYFMFKKRKIIIS